MNSFEYDGKNVSHNVGSPVRIWIKPFNGDTEDKPLMMFEFDHLASPDDNFDSMVSNTSVMVGDLPYDMKGPGITFSGGYIISSVASWAHQTHKELWDWLRKEDFQLRLKAEIDSVIVKEAERLYAGDQASAVGGSLTEGTNHGGETEELPDYESSQSASLASGATAGSGQQF